MPFCTYMFVIYYNLEMIYRKIKVSKCGDGLRKPSITTYINFLPDEILPLQG